MTRSEDVYTCVCGLTTKTTVFMGDVPPFSVTGSMREYSAVFNATTGGAKVARF